jgi:hypothetical protein
MLNRDEMMGLEDRAALYARCIIIDFTINEYFYYKKEQKFT